MLFITYHLFSIKWQYKYKFRFWVCGVRNREVEVKKYRWGVEKLEEVLIFLVKDNMPETIQQLGFEVISHGDSEAQRRVLAGVGVRVVLGFFWRDGGEGENCWRVPLG
jgi:hypothetical protein